MLDQLVLWEKELFLALNNAHTPFWDAFMLLISARWMWVVTALMLIIFLFYKRPAKEGWLVILTAALMILCCDQLVSSVMKPFFARFRPTYHLFTKHEVMTVFDYLGGGFGFISGHASNFFAISTLTALIFRDKIYGTLVFLLATTVAYSRIYLGMHFITDVVPGALFGLLLGWLFYLLYRRVRRSLLRPREEQPERVFQKNIAFLRLTLALMILFLAAAAGDFSHALVRADYYSMLSEAIPTMPLFPPSL